MNDGGEDGIGLRAHEFANSAIFSAPAGDLSLSQPINFIAPGATFFGGVGGSFGSVDFTIDSIFVTTSPVPEPAEYSLLLAGLAALGWVARRRRG